MNSKPRPSSKLTFQNHERRSGRREKSREIERTTMSGGVAALRGGKLKSFGHGELESEAREIREEKP
jgi:hypothetical protein